MTLPLIGSPLCPTLEAHEWFISCTPDTHPYQWHSRNIYDRAASDASAVVNLISDYNLRTTPLYRAAIELIQSRHPDAFIVVPDSSWISAGTVHPQSALLKWYQGWGYKTITIAYVLVAGGQIEWVTEQRMLRSRADTLYALDPTTIQEGPRNFTVWSPYMPKTRTITLHSIPIAVPSLSPGWRMMSEADTAASVWSDCTDHDVIYTEHVDDKGCRCYALRHRLTGAISVCGGWPDADFHPLTPDDASPTTARDPATGKAVR